MRVLGGNLSPEFSAVLKLAGVEGGLENNIFRGKANVFDSEHDLLDAPENTPDDFKNNDMIIVRYEGPSGAPGMPEMLDPTSRITTLCRERNINVGLMTDARFSGGSVGLVIGHVGPEAALGGPIALVEDSDEIIVDLNKNELNCTPLFDPATFETRMSNWRKVVDDNGGMHPPWVKPTRGSSIGCADQLCLRFMARACTRIAFFGSTIRVKRRFPDLYRTISIGTLAPQNNAAPSKSIVDCVLAGNDDRFVHKADGTIWPRKFAGFRNDVGPSTFARFLGAMSYLFFER